MISTFGKQRSLLFSMEMYGFANGVEPKWVIVGQTITPLLQFSGTGLQGVPDSQAAAQPLRSPGIPDAHQEEGANGKFPCPGWGQPGGGLASAPSELSSEAAAWHFDLVCPSDPGALRSESSCL